MRKTAAALVALASLAAGSVAAAQDGDPTGVTSLDPLQAILDGFTAGEDVDDLYLSSGDPDATVLSQFQMVVNFSRIPRDGISNVELIPTGLAADAPLELVSLEEQFDGTLGQFSRVPPLAPFLRDRTQDITALAEGWAAYNDEGLIEGPVELFSPMQVIAGIELTEPLIPCAELSVVGRAWVGDTVSAPDPLFTAEALDEMHAELAGRASRFVELQCFDDSLIVRSSRMRDDARAGNFTSSTVVLVKDNFVVIFAEADMLDSDLTQRFFASPPAGGAVVLTEVETEPRILLPNPYSPDDVRLELRVVESPADADAANGAGDQSQTRSLLFHDNDMGGIVPLGTSGVFCNLEDTILFWFVAAQRVMGRDTSTAGTAEMEDGVLTTTQRYANGGSQQTTYDTRSDTGEVVMNGACTVLVEGETTPSLADDSGSGDEAGDSGGDSDPDAGGETDTGETSEPEGDDGGGFPWGPVALGLIAVATTTAVVRRRSGSKNCEPERQAYAAAQAAKDQAFKAGEKADADLRDAKDEYGRLKAETTNPLGDTPDPDLLEDWEEYEEVRRQAEGKVDAAKAAVDAAQAVSDTAWQEFQVWRQRTEEARVALENCEGSSIAADDGDAGGGGGTGGGEAAPPTSPGTITEPPDEPSESECVDGETKERVESQDTFEIPGGDVLIRLDKTQWTGAYPGGLIDPAELVALGDGDLQDLFSQLEDNVEAEIMSYTIPTTLLTVKCIRVSVCRGGSWVEADEMKRVEERAKGPGRRGTTRTQSKVLAQRLVKKAQDELEVLQENAGAAADFTCD